MSNWPFNADVPHNEWTMIEADGFSEPAPGCVYDGHRLDGGIPLGGARHRLLHAGRFRADRPLLDLQRHRAAAGRLHGMADGQNSRRGEPAAIHGGHRLLGTSSHC